MRAQGYVTQTDYNEKNIVGPNRNALPNHKSMKDTALKTLKHNRSNKRSDIKAHAHNTNTKDDTDCDSGDVIIFAFRFINDVYQPVDIANSFGHPVSDDDDGPPKLSDSNTDLETDPQENPHPVALLERYYLSMYRKQ